MLFCVMLTDKSRSISVPAKFLDNHFRFSSSSLFYFYFLKNMRGCIHLIKMPRTRNEVKKVIQSNQRTRPYLNKQKP